MPSETASKCDIVYLAKGRPEFTAASWEALRANTNWDRVGALIVYTDGTEPIHALDEIEHDTCTIECGGPVGVMNLYLRCEPAPVWAKIDNDVIVPPGWLDQCLDVMGAHPELDLLGVEPPLSRTPAPWAPNVRPPAPEGDHMKHKHLFKDVNPACARGGCHAPTDSIGGIGLFRTRAWENRPPMKPFATYGGFTDWQLSEGRLRHGRSPLCIGWVVPPLRLFLLDRLTIEPWASLSKRYIAEGQQRPWTNYNQVEQAALASWWLK